jgi:hypothetical protein
VPGKSRDFHTASRWRLPIPLGRRSPDRSHNQDRKPHDEAIGHHEVGQWACLAITGRASAQQNSAGVPTSIRPVIAITYAIAVTGSCREIWGVLSIAPYGMMCSPAVLAVRSGYGARSPANLPRRGASAPIAGFTRGLLHKGPSGIPGDSRPAYAKLGTAACHYI